MARDDDFLELAKKRFEQSQQSDREQRQRELDDLKAYTGDTWDQGTLDARAAQPASGNLPPLPARPSLKIPLLKEPIRQVLNAERQSELGLEIVPADDFAGLIGPLDDTEIELREGLVRRIQRESAAADARTWAFTRAVIAGRGYYGVMTRYLPGKTWDQEIYVHRYYNQASVSLDPAHEQPDGSDAEWAFVGNDLPWDEYKARWPQAVNEGRNRVTNASEDEFRALGDDAPGWFTTMGDVRMCRVVDYWYTVRTTRTLCRLPGGVRAWEDELPKGLDIPAEDKRKVTDKQIKWAQIDGIQILDETDWPGPDLPIVKVLGEELQPYDQERRAEGMVRPARDSNAGFNAMMSKWVETIGLSPIPPFQATPDQIEGFEPLYQQANIRPVPVLFYNLVSDGGKPLGPPTRTPVDTPIQAIASSVQLFRDLIQSTTGIHDPQLGKVDPSIKSGRAIKFLQEQSAHGTSNFLDNLKRSIRYEGQIINNLLCGIYGTPGRIARILNAEGEAQTVQIGSPNGQPAGAAMMGGNGQKPYKLTKDANFNVIIRVTRAYDSRRTEEASMIGDMLTANPELMTVFGDLFFANTDGPGHQQLADRAKLILRPEIQQMLQEKSQDKGLPPEAQMLVQQLQQQLQQAQQMLQAQGQELQTRQGEQQTKVQIAQMEIQSKERIAEQDRAARIAIAHIAAASKGAAIDAHADEEALALGHQAMQADLSRDHEREMAARGQVHEAATGMMQQDAQSAEAERDRQHQAELAQQAAQQAPPQETA